MPSREAEAAARAEYETRLQKETEKRAKLAEEVKARREADQRREADERKGTKSKKATVKHCHLFSITLSVAYSVLVAQVAAAIHVQTQLLRILSNIAIASYV